MKHNLDDAVLMKTGHQSVYKLRQQGLRNEYLIVSGDGTRRLMASPEVVGFGSYQSMVPATMRGMQYLVDNGLGGDVNILTILRGGLNYPIEECAFRAGLRVTNMDFLSCERIIEDDVIKGLDVRYQKVRTCKDCVLMVGDIIASGATLRMCMEHVIEWFRSHGGSFRKIVFFTIGGSNAIDLMEDLTDKILSSPASFTRGYSMSIRILGYWVSRSRTSTSTGETGLSAPSSGNMWSHIHIHCTRSA